MDAQTLFREGVIAIKDKRDVAEGRKLLTQSLRLNPNNEMAWLWLSRTVADREKKLQCLERALSINPANEQAILLKERLLEDSNGSTTTVIVEPVSEAPTPQKKELTADDERRIKTLLNRAESYLSEGKTEDAIEQWVQALAIQPDHEMAMAMAVRHLSRLKYIDDAKELVWRALDSGTTVPSIYLTAVDIAQHLGDAVEADTLRDRLARLPTADDELVSRIVDYYMDQDLHGRAIEILEHALATHSHSQKLLIRMGDLQKAFANDGDARKYYERAARRGTGTKEGREADKRLLESAPLLTDSERGSIFLAFREALGFGSLWLLLAWQDAGLSFALVGPSRWLGVGLSVVGGYLLDTAIWSPQQRPLAGMLGGQVPEPKKRDAKPKSDALNKSAQVGALEDDTHLPILPPAVRFIFAAVGIAILIFAFTLVFSRAISLLQNPVPPTDVPTIQDLISEYAP